MVRIRWFSLAAALTLLVGCTDDGGAASTTSPIEVTTTTPAPGETTTTTTPRLVIEELPGTESLPQEVRDELIELVNITQELRELNFLEAPMVSVVTNDELEALVREQIEEEAESLPADQALYELLGLLDGNTDLRTMLTDLYGEQVAGFYDGDTDELVVPITASGFSQVQRATLIHELTHALTDQIFDFHPKYQAMFDEERYDEASAYQALIEGDASFAEVLYLQTLTQQELGEFFGEALQAGTEQFESAPAFIQEALLFPYDAGLTFVQAMYMDSGWDPVNEAYARFLDLPGSTEQIITPDDYERDLPIEVIMPTIEVPGYELTESSVWGELGFRILFDEVLGDNETLIAADGWGGDRYSFWYDGSNAVFVLVFEGDTATDNDEAEDALLTFAQTSVPEPAFVWVEVINDQLTFIASDVPSVGETIRDTLKG